MKWTPHANMGWLTNTRELRDHREEKQMREKRLATNRARVIWNICAQRRIAGQKRKCDVSPGKMSTRWGRHTMILCHSEICICIMQNHSDDFRWLLSNANKFFSASFHVWARGGHPLAINADKEIHWIPFLIPNCIHPPTHTHAGHNR